MRGERLGRCSPGVPPADCALTNDDCLLLMMYRVRPTQGEAPIKPGGQSEGWSDEKFLWPSRVDVHSSSMLDPPRRLSHARATDAR